MEIDSPIADVVYVLFTCAAVPYSIMLLKKYAVPLSWKRDLFPVSVGPLLYVLFPEHIAKIFFIKGIINVTYGAACFVCLLPVRSLTLRNRALLALFYAALAPAYAVLSFAIYLFILVVVLGRDLCG